ncbi:hypothetical protein EXN22_16415 [Pseudomonas tructae]|uniref:Uncharacterized protein n=1 Tax=Pseudomonas tructae TaxID=2518644 RepID=A0A411MK99_9PSED|nr:hypothetical protein [Pseudomonas tructae]QBF27198.1 hypothetical protein EXN22_16415 [Pseudomonas tructae]
MSAEVFQFPSARRAHNNQVAANQVERKKLADWFRSVAQHIEGNEVEREPLAAMIVLSSAKGDEVLHVGYSTEATSLVQAGNAARQWAHLTCQRRGGNFFDRQR